MMATAEPHAESLALLRVLVSVLGGAGHAGWWRTEFLTPAGLRFLERLYPRTKLPAAVQATAIAARQRHDSAIGRGAVYHLFRLPPALEARIEALAQGGLIDEVVSRLQPSLDERQALLAHFHEIGGELSELEAGPQRVGNLGDIMRVDSLGKWAGAYMHAFTNDYQVFPYFDSETSR